MQKISIDQFKDKMKDLVLADALEVVSDPERPGRLYIPYMMSDCVEDYLLIDLRKDARSHVRDPEAMRDLLAAWAGGGTDGSPGIGQIEEIWESRTYYQYHRPGHYWVQGEEHLRRLVYQLGCIHEKMTYLGREAVSEKEMELARLVEFGPLRFFSPTGEKLDDRYQNSEEGVSVMLDLARTCGDSRLSWLAASFGKLPGWELRNYLIDYLSSDRGFAFCHVLQIELELASKPYASRRFSDETEAWAQMERRCIDAALREEGYVGRYPHYRSRDRKRILLVTEEMPFAMSLLDYRDMAYRFYRQETLLEQGHLMTEIRKLAERPVDETR